tara:strand:- start:66 stop:263 length:198 start_codon:yes stop_codon:yes gene_type:complete
MCTPVLAGGLAGYGVQQLTDKDKRPASVTNNYYGKDGSEGTLEEGGEDTPAKNKKTLKVGGAKTK